MTTNDEIIDKEDERLGREKEEDNLFGYQSVNSMLNEARADTIKKHIGTIWDWWATRTIWDWWATKPQVRKNDATIRIITRTDIEELVRLMK